MANSQIPIFLAVIIVILLRLPGSEGINKNYYDDVTGWGCRIACVDFSSRKSVISYRFRRGHKSLELIYTSCGGWVEYLVD